MVATTEEAMATTEEAMAMDIHQDVIQQLETPLEWVTMRQDLAFGLDLEREVFLAIYLDQGLIIQPMEETMATNRLTDQPGD